MTILHIVPSHPPKADVALTLARSLRKNYQLESLFYSDKPLPDVIYSAYGFSVIPPSQSSLDAEIPSDVKTILLHVNYSFYKSYRDKSKKNNFIEQLKQTIERRSLELITIFHEIPTTKFAPIFVINPVYKAFTKQLADLSISIITNNRFFERHLIENTNTQTICLNNFSRVGELTSHNLLGASRCNLVILGGAERINIYKNRALLQQTVETLKLNQIVDIGQNLNWSGINTKGLNIRKMGPLLKSEISDQLTISKVGILDYSRFPGCLGRSSVFNAYKAHGVAPLMFKNMNSTGDHIVSGVNYFTANDMSTLRSNRSIARMAHTNYSRYQTHNQKQWCRLIRELIKG